MRLFGYLLALWLPLFAMAPLQVKTVQSGYLTLTDDSTWNVGFIYQFLSDDWEPGDPVQISFHVTLPIFNNIRLYNLAKEECVWGTLRSRPKKSIITDVSHTSGQLVLHLENNGQLVGTNNPNLQWQAGDLCIPIYNPSDKTYSLFHCTHNTAHPYFTFKETNRPSSNTKDLDVQNLHGRLTQSIIGQEKAIDGVSTAILNYALGLQPIEKPIHVFLFLGPTGVGKTALAKAITEAIYHDPLRLIRLDMSHFNEQHSISRLMGSPPGYTGYDKPGQLTDPLSRQQKSVVLLDEAEKAHSAVLKFFLPVFDEGFIVDSKGQRYPCNQTLFILTSNLCGAEIASLFEKHYTDEEILRRIEPKLLQSLSPELYARTTPILFHPHTKESLEHILNLSLNEVIQRYKSAPCHLDVTIDESAKAYLRQFGFIPKLGARG